LSSFGRQQLDRTKQPGREQRRVCSVELLSRVRVGLRDPWLLVPDEPVDPEVGDLDLNGVTSTRNGAFQMMPSGLPFMVTSAIFFTSPRSTIRRVPDWNQFFGASIEFVYVAVPEKYFTPDSALSDHDTSLSKVIRSGAPRPG
jgi:hypothetical protein